MRRKFALASTKFSIKPLKQTTSSICWRDNSQCLFLKVREFLCSHYRLTCCHNFQFEKHVCEILSRPFHYSSFSRVVSAHNEEVFSNKTILCCRGRRKTDTYNRSRAVFVQGPRKFLPIDSNDHQTDSKAS